MDELSAIARELRAARERLKLTREQLAEKIGYTAGYIEKIETGKLAATEPYVAAAMKVLAEGVEAKALFDRLRQDERREVVPGWFRPWVEHEEEANEIRWYEPLLIPGLLQIEAYARVLLEDGSPDEAESLLAARMERQQVLERAQLIAIIYESVLRQHVGDHAVMYEQLQHLTTSRAVVQVLPTGADTYRHLEGSFALATVDGTELGYVDTPARGFLLDAPEVVSKLQRRWNAIVAEALPRRQSRDLILKVAEQWKTNDR